MRRSALVVVAVLLAAGCATPDDPGVQGGRGLVASSDAAAAQAGAEILRQGGNAVDAAAAVAFALTVTEPHLSGIGGGTFIHYLSPGGRSTILDGREVAPLAATPDQFMADDGPMPFDAAHTSGLAVGVPGAVLAWATAVERWGRLGLADALAPAIRLADEGAPVSQRLANAFANPDNAAKLRSWPASAQLFYPGAICPQMLPMVAGEGCTGGRVLGADEPFIQPDLAGTLRLLAEGGTDAFYDGAVAEDLVNTVAARDGRMLVTDLASYEVVEREALALRYHDVELRTMPPPGGGLVVLQMLGILEPMELAAAPHGSVADLHHFIEASHLAYADRAAYLGDPAFVDVPVEALLDPDYLAARRALIDPLRANPGISAGSPDGRTPPARRAVDLDPDAHTSHFIVVDLDGAVVSATATIESAFGNGMVVPGRGFLLNNEMTDFDFTPGGANEVQPGKRPRSAMSPTIGLRDGSPVFAVGAAGGPTIIATTATVSLSVLEHGLGVEEAVAAGRVHSPAYPAVQWERSLPPAVIDGLRAMGHEPGEQGVGSIGVLQAAHVEGGRWVGASRTAGGVVYVDSPE